MGTVRKVVMAWVAPDIDDGPSQGSLNVPPNLALVVRFAQWFGFCPVAPCDISRRLLVTFWCFCIFSIQFMFTADVIHVLTRKVALFDFFAEESMHGLLYTCMAVQATVHQFVCLFLTTKWKNLVHAMRTLPEQRLTSECRRDLQMVCRGGVGVSSAVVALYIGYLFAFKSRRPNVTPYVNVLIQLQHFFIFTAIATPCLLVVAFCRSLGEHFAALRHDYLKRFHGSPTKRFGVADAHAVAEVYFRVRSASPPCSRGQPIALQLTASVDALDGIFAWYMMTSTVASMVSGTFTVYLFIGYMNSRIVVNMHLWLLIAAQQVCCLLMLYDGVRLNEEARRIKKDLAVASGDRYEPGAKEIMQKVLAHTKDGDWGLSVGSFFVLSRSVILSIISVVFAHVLVLVELLGVMPAVTANSTADAGID